jgi:predicted PurR-regulated permease PerM
MQRTPWLTILVILLAIIAGLFLAQMLWQLMAAFADIILLFVLAWVVAFALAPLIERINGKPLPQAAVNLVERTLGNRFAKRVENFRFSRAQAVTIVYIGLVLVLLEALSALVPPMLDQLNGLALLFPDFAKRTPELANVAQRFLNDLGLRNLNVQSALPTALGNLQNVATPVLQNAIGILTGILTVLGNVLVVLILSFFFALDGPRLFRTVFELIPEEFDSEMRMLVVTIDRTFGGFIRAQFLQALMVGVGTGLVMALFGGQYVLVTSLFAGLMMLIPFLGPVLALVPPFVVTVIRDPGELLIILIILLAYQFVIGNIVMPKLMSEALGMHPLVVIASLLVGVKLGGLWGAFFGIPVAGVASTMALFFYRKWRRPPEQTAQAGASPGSYTAPASIAAAPLNPSPPSTASRPPRDLEKERA